MPLSCFGRVGSLSEGQLLSRLVLQDPLAIPLPMRSLRPKRAATEEVVGRRVVFRRLFPLLLIQQDLPLQSTQKDLPPQEIQQDFPPQEIQQDLPPQ